MSRIWSVNDVTDWLNASSDGFTIREIAALYSVPKSTVHYRLQKLKLKNKPKGDYLLPWHCNADKSCMFVLEKGSDMSNGGDDRD